MATTFLQGICSSLKSTEIADDNKIVSLQEQAVSGERQSRSQPALGMAPKSQRPAMGRSLSAHQHKGGCVSVKSTLSTAHFTQRSLKAALAWPL